METKTIRRSSNLHQNEDPVAINYTQNSPEMEILHNSPESCNSNDALTPESTVLVPHHLCTSEDVVGEKKTKMNSDSQVNRFERPTAIQTFDAGTPIRELSPPTLIPISQLSHFVDKFWTNNNCQRSRSRELSPPVLTPVSPQKEKIPTSISSHEYNICNTTMFNENEQTDCAKEITKSPLPAHFPTAENACRDTSQHSIKFGQNITRTNEDFGKLKFPHVVHDPKTFPEQTFMPIQEEPLNLSVSAAPHEREAPYELHVHQYSKAGETVKPEEVQETFQQLPQRHFFIGPNNHFTNYFPNAAKTATEIEESSLYLPTSSFKYGLGNANVPFSKFESNASGPREVTTPFRPTNHPRTFLEHVPKFKHNYLNDSTLNLRTPCINIRKNNAVLSNQVSSLPVPAFELEPAHDVSITHCHFVSLPSYPRTLTVNKKSAFKPIRVRKYKSNRGSPCSYYQPLLNRPVQGQNVYKHCLQNPHRHRRVVVLKIDSSKPNLSCIQYSSLTSSVQVQNTECENNPS